MSSVRGAGRPTGSPYDTTAVFAIRQHIARQVEIRDPERRGEFREGEARTVFIQAPEDVSGVRQCVLRHLVRQHRLLGDHAHIRLDRCQHAVGDRDLRRPDVIRTGTDQPVEARFGDCVAVYEHEIENAEVPGAPSD